MTLDQIMALPDAELTRLAAEKVMGWDCLLATGGLYHFYKPGYAYPAEMAESDWHPDTRMDHAWMLNERIKSGNNFCNYCDYLTEVIGAKEGAYRNCEDELWHIVTFLRYAEPIDFTRAAVLTVMEAESQ